jgi:arylsulfatase
MGFEQFYGFMGGDADQWTPGSLFRDTPHIEPFIGNPQWNLITGMADEAIQWVNTLNDINPTIPYPLVLRARRHALTAPSDAGMGQEDQ